MSELRTTEPIATIRTSGWIDCNERLPAGAGACVDFICHAGQRRGVYCGAGQFVSDPPEDWTYQAHQVSAWRPLSIPVNLPDIGVGQ